MKIKGLVIGSLLTTLVITAYAQPQSQALISTCAQNPDLFLIIKSGLASTVTITQMQSFSQVNGTVTPLNPNTLGMTGNTTILVGFANAACLRLNRVFSVAVGVKGLTANAQSTGGVPITSLLASAQPTPGVGITTPVPIGSQPSSQIAIVQLPTTTLPVNCTLTTNQIQAGTLTKTITFDPTTQTYFCN